MNRRLEPFADIGEAMRELPEPWQKIFVVMFVAGPFIGAVLGLLMAMYCGC